MTRTLLLRLLSLLWGVSFLREETLPYRGVFRTPGPGLMSDMDPHVYVYSPCDAWMIVPLGFSARAQR